MIRRFCFLLVGWAIVSLPGREACAQWNYNYGGWGWGGWGWGSRAFAGIPVTYSCWRWVPTAWGSARVWVC